VVTEWTDRLSGESSRTGSVVLSWKDVTREGLDLHEAYNVILHEFAHQLDADDGITAETTVAAGDPRVGTLLHSLKEGHRRLRRDLARGRATVLDPYGEESLEEFFAVAAESFFERPKALKDWDSGLFAELVAYFRQNPSEWGNEEQLKNC